MKYKCPNHDRGCSFQGSKNAIIDHLRGVCSYQDRTVQQEYQRKDDSFFDTLLTAYIVSEIFSDHGGAVGDYSLPIFNGGGGGESGGGGASGSWESDSSSSSDSDSSSDSSSSDSSSSDSSSSGSGD